MAKHTLTGNEKGNFDDLKIDTVDPSDLEEETGEPKLLSWTLKHTKPGAFPQSYTAGESVKEYWEAKGKDGKIYIIENDDVPVAKKGKVRIV